MATSNNHITQAMTDGNEQRFNHTAELRSMLQPLSACVM